MVRTAEGIRLEPWHVALIGTGGALIGYGLRGLFPAVASQPPSSSGALLPEHVKTNPLPAKTLKTAKRLRAQPLPDDADLRYAPNPFALNVAPEAMLLPASRPQWTATTDRRAEWNPPLLDGRTVYTIERASWEYAGTMFTAAPHFRDVAQGATSNCNFMSSLASVACVWPSILTARARLVSDPSGERLREISFHDGTANRAVLVSERVPQYRVRYLDGRRAVILPCAQNTWSQSGETFPAWPAVYEKACAAFGLGVAHDQPQLLIPSYWIPSAFDAEGLPSATVHPLTGLTGLPTERADTLPMSADDLWEFLRQRTDTNGGPTVPMILGTRPAEGLSAETWDRLRLVPEHAYSVLGAFASGGERFVVLRNPWGDYQPEGEGTAPGRWMGEPLGARGLFAYELHRVKELFGSHERCRFYVTAR